MPNNNSMTAQRLAEVLNDLIVEQNSLLNTIKATTDEKQFKMIEKEIQLNSAIIKNITKLFQLQSKKEAAN